VRWTFPTAGRHQTLHPSGRAAFLYEGGYTLAEIIASVAPPYQKSPIDQDDHLADRPQGGQLITPSPASYVDSLATARRSSGRSTVISSWYVSEAKYTDTMVMRESTAMYVAISHGSPPA
jgi:hypothetical protein